MPPSLTTVNVTGNPTLLYGSQGSSASPLTIINNDPANTIWVGNQSNIMAGSSNTIPLAPGDSFTSDGSVTLYAVTSGPVVAVAITPGGNSYSPGTLAISGPVTATISGPVAISSIAAPVAIASIAGSVAIGSVAGNVDITPTAGYIPAGLQAIIGSIANATVISPSVQTAILPVAAYNSFNLAVAVATSSQGTAGAAFSCQVTLQWFADAAGTMPLALETFWIWSSNSIAAASQVPAYLSGPMQGAYMQVTLANPGTTNEVVALCNLWGNGSAVPATRAYQAPPTSGQITNSSQHYLSPGVANGTDGFLTSLIDETVLSASTAYWVPGPLQVGPVDTFCVTNGTAMSVQPTLCYLKAALFGGLAVAAGNNGQILWTPPGNTAGTTYNGQNIFQPRSPVYWLLTPGATAPTSVTITATCSPN